MLKSVVMPASNQNQVEPLDAETLLVTESMPADEVIHLFTTTDLKHLVQKNGPAYDDEVCLAHLMHQQPREFLEYPIDTILYPSGADRSARKIDVYLTGSVRQKKMDVLDAFENYLRGLNGSKAIRDQAMMIADELVTNGIKNAWVEGQKPFKDEPGRDGIIEFFAHAENKRLVFGCRDSFGELRLGRVLSRIQMCYDNGVAQSINHGLGGAGIGSYIVFNGCLGYYAGVEKGVRSVVCVALPLGMGMKDAVLLPKNVHLVSIE